MEAPSLAVDVNLWDAATDTLLRSRVHLKVTAKGSTRLRSDGTRVALPVPCASAARTVEHPFGTLKMRMGATQFLTKRLPKVATEMALHVLAYSLTRVINIVGIQPFMAAIRA
jgi:hypothetical protein